VGIAVLADRRGWWLGRLAIVALAVGLMGHSGLSRLSGTAARLVYDGDSAYARLQVADVAVQGRTERLLLTDYRSAQSGIYVDDPTEPIFNYTKRFLQVAEAYGRTPRVLLIGGGAYTLPRQILKQYPEARVDVVEIDPKLDELAERYFGARSDRRVRIMHEDGRMFLNANRQSYDLIYMDAFSSVTPPFQLTTREAVQQLARALAPGGLIAVNLISAQVGKAAGFGEAEFATYQEQLGSVVVGPAEVGTNPTEQQNLILLAGNVDVAGVASQVGLETFRPGAGRTLTDDFAPVEQLTAE
jgi:spermidine synthase